MTNIGLRGHRFYVFQRFIAFAGKNWYNDTVHRILLIRDKAVWCIGEVWAAAGIEGRIVRVFFELTEL